MEETKTPIHGLIDETKFNQEVMRVGRRVLRPLSLLQMVFFLAIISSPFIWIWGSLGLAWKVGLTGVIGMVLVAWVYNSFKKSIAKSLKEINANPDRVVKTSKFQQKLEQMELEKKNRKN